MSGGWMGESIYERVARWKGRAPWTVPQFDLRIDSILFLQHSQRVFLVIHFLVRWLIFRDVFLFLLLIVLLSFLEKGSTPWRGLIICRCRFWVGVQVLSAVSIIVAIIFFCVWGINDMPAEKEMMFHLSEKNSVDRFGS